MYTDLYPVKQYRQKIENGVLLLTPTLKRAICKAQGMALTAKMDLVILKDHVDAVMEIYMGDEKSHPRSAIEDTSWDEIEYLESAVEIPVDSIFSDGEEVALSIYEDGTIEVFPVE